MANKKLNEFLNIYKKIEIALKNQNMDVKDYEETLDSSESQKLRLCRNIRNYAAHHDDVDLFIEISNDMLTFLTKIFSNITANESHVKDIMNKKAIATENTTLKEIAKIFESSKANIIVIKSSKDNKYIGIFDINSLYKMIAIENRFTAKIKNYIKIPKLNTINIINQNALLNEIDKSTINIAVNSVNSVVGVIESQYTL